MGSVDRFQLGTGNSHSKNAERRSSIMAREAAGFCIRRELKTTWKLCRPVSAAESSRICAHCLLRRYSHCDEDPKTPNTATEV